MKRTYLSRPTSKLVTQLLEGLRPQQEAEEHVLTEADFFGTDSGTLPLPGGLTEREVEIKSPSWISQEEIESLIRPRGRDLNFVDNLDKKLPSLFDTVHEWLMEQGVPIERFNRASPVSYRRIKNGYRPTDRELDLIAKAIGMSTTALLERQSPPHSQHDGQRIFVVMVLVNNPDIVQDMKARYQVNPHEFPWPYGGRSGDSLLGHAFQDAFELPSGKPRCAVCYGNLLQTFYSVANI